MPRKPHQQSIATNARVHDILVRMSTWQHRSISELVADGLRRYLAGELAVERAGRTRPARRYAAPYVPRPRDEYAAELVEGRRVLGLYIDDTLMAEVRKKAQLDGTLLTDIVAAIAADVDPLAGGREKAYIQGLAREAGLDVDDNTAAIFVLWVHLRRAPSPRDLIRSVVSKLPHASPGPLEGRLLLACALDWMERADTIEGLPHNTAELLRPWLGLPGEDLVSPAAVTARTLASMIPWPDVRPLALYLLVLAAQLHQITDRALVSPTWRLFVGEFPEELATELLRPLGALLRMRSLPKREIHGKVQEEVQYANLWQEGVLEAFCALVCGVGKDRAQRRDTENR